MTLLTIEEYLDLEERADVKHEYVGGQVYAMSGVTKRHNLIAINLVTELRAAAKGTDCRVYIADVKVRASRDVIYYPDVMVACGPDRGSALVEEAPCLVVEVISPSTEMIDRREKLLVYRRLESLRSYLVVDQAARRIDHHWRADDGTWQREVVEGSGRVSIACPGTTLTLAAIYEGAGVVD
jgi:Uma2 family endonuclease